MTATTPPAVCSCHAVLPPTWMTSHSRGRCLHKTHDAGTVRQAKSEQQTAWLMQPNVRSSSRACCMSMCCSWHRDRYGWVGGAPWSDGLSIVPRSSDLSSNTFSHLRMLRRDGGLARGVSFSTSKRDATTSIGSRVSSGVTANALKRRRMLSRCGPVIALSDVRMMCSSMLRSWLLSLNSSRRSSTTPSQLSVTPISCTSLPAMPIAMLAVVVHYSKDIPDRQNETGPLIELT